MTEAKTKDKADDLTIPKVAMPEGWVTIGERFLYRAGPPGSNPGTEDHKGKPRLHCGTLPIQGYIVDAETRFSDAFESDYSQVVLQLTQPCIGIDNGKHVKLAPGQVLVVTATAALTEFARFAKHPTHTVEVFLQPLGWLDVGGGNTMRQWKRVIAPKLHLRSNLALPKLPDLPPVHQLAAANGAQQGAADVGF